MTKRNIVRLFESRKGHLEYRIKRDYVRNGIAMIPCRISDYSDVINSYSIRGCETLNTDFLDYVTTAADVTPTECPLVLNIIGNCLSPEEKKIIEVVVRDDFAYDLGMVEKDEKRQMKFYTFMFVGLLLYGIVLCLTEQLAAGPRELIWIMFWFMGEYVCDYLFMTGYDLREKRRLAGRLASVKVVFSDTYEEPEFTESDVDQLYSEIEKEVKETLQEERDNDEEAVYDR